MGRDRLGVIDDYEVTGLPVVSPRGLVYRPWLEMAVEPYNATRLPHCTVHGLWDALRHADPVTLPEPEDDDIDRLRIIQL